MILVAGATGNVGAEVVTALAGMGRGVRALSRKGQVDGLPPGVESVVGDLDDLDTLGPALQGITSAFLLPGAKDMRGLVDAIAEAGGERVVMLSGTSAASGDRSNAISRYMIDSEAAVRSGPLPWTFVRPASFMSNALRWLPQIQAGDVVRAPFADVSVAIIDPFDIGAVIAEVLDSGSHDGEILHITGPRSLQPADQIAVLAEVLGRPLQLDPISDADAPTVLAENTPPEYVDAQIDFYVKGSLDDSQVLPTVRAVTGHEPRSFVEWATAHAAEFGND